MPPALSLVNAMPIIRSISVLDAQGIQVMGTRDQHNGTDFSHRPYYQTVLGDPQPLKLHISPPYRSVRGDLTLSLSKAIYDEDSAFSGVVIVSLEPSYLRRLMESTLYAPDMWAALRHIDGDHVIQVLGGIPGERQDTSSGELGLVKLPLPPRDGGPLVMESQEDGTLQLVKEALQEPSEQQFRARSTTPQGLRHMEWALCSVVGPDKTLQGVIGIGHDISVHILLNEQLRTLAERDGLTGLYNHRHLSEAGAVQIAQAQRYGQPLSIMLLDLDHFKRVNDTYGHHVGDLTLQLCARLMQKVSRDSDLPIRVGGEELAILLPNTPLEGAVQAAQRLRKLIEQTPVQHEEGNHFFVTASFGVASLAAGETLEGLMQRADQALYSAKQNGRNRVDYHPSSKAALTR